MVLVGVREGDGFPWPWFLPRSEVSSVCFKDRNPSSSQERGRAPSPRGGVRTARLRTCHSERSEESPRSFVVLGTTQDDKSLHPPPKASRMTDFPVIPALLRAMDIALRRTGSGGNPGKNVYQRRRDQPTPCVASNHLRLLRSKLSILS
jgi:hypothetical protein